jgi:hypothetical protein
VATPRHYDGDLYGAALWDYIGQHAREHGLEPNLARAFVPLEGGAQGASGDKGTSFGPWQLHIGGALPKAHERDAAAWANSPAGVDYALEQLGRTVKTHAPNYDPVAGTWVASATDAIARYFEKPAEPPKGIGWQAESQRAQANYARMTDQGSASDWTSYDANDAARNVADAAKTVAHPFAQLADLVGKLAGWLGNPQSWIRVGLGVGGFLLLFFGVRHALTG